MRNNLKLITTETFGDLSCNFYCNMNDDILLTREQIGQALEYKRPDDAIYRIHKRHQNRLDQLSICLPDGLGHELYYYTQRGVMEICRWSNSNKANEFMDWVWNIVEAFRTKELVHTKQINMTPITDAISSMTQAITAISNNMITMQQDILSLKEQSNKKKLPEKKYSRWKTNTFNKLNTLHSYVNEHSDENLKLSETIHLVIEETEDTYAIEINDYVDAYKSEFDLDTNPYVLDVINRYKDVRDMFSLTLDSVMEKLHLIDKSDKSKPRNIFDELASKLEK